MEKDVSVRRYRVVDQVYDIVKAQIIQGTLKPGERILADELAQKLNASKTPIREALNRLKGENLVVDTKKGKMSVVKFTHEEIAQICELRGSMETLALRWGFENISREKLKQNLAMSRKIKEELDRHDSSDFYEVDTMLHSIIINSAGNQWLAQIISQLRNLIEITRHMFASVNRDKESIREHITVIESLLEGNKKEAVKQLNSHIEHLKNHLLDQISRAKASTNEG